MEELKLLTAAQRELLFDAPVLVTILIAGADSDIDEAEIKRAVELTHDKKITSREELIEFYEIVGEGFEDKLKVKIHQLPLDAEKRNALIIEELIKLNSVLPVLSKDFATNYYWSIRSLAKKIAGASGGVLGYLAVGYEESKLVGLDMIDNPEA
jgi:hypothetical protein